LEEIGNSETSRKSVSFGGQSKIMSEKTRADETGEAADEDAGGNKYR